MIIKYFALLRPVFFLGVEHSKIFGEKLQNVGKRPGLFLTSTYQRCRKTLEFIQNGWGIEAEIREERLLANAFTENGRLAHHSLLSLGAYE